MTALQFALLLATLVLGGVLGLVLGKAQARRRRALLPDTSPQREAERLRAEAQEEARGLVREAEIAAREAALAARAEGEASLRARESELADAQTRLAARAVALDLEGEGLVQARQRLEARQAPIAAHEAEREAQLKEARSLHASARGTLERAAGEKAEALRDGIMEAEIEEARAAAAQMLRHISEGATAPEHVRDAKRVMGISVGRFAGHYLTERHLSLVPLGERRNGQPAVKEGDLRAIEGVANIKLSFTEGEEAVRIEGLDGVAREVARRCLANLLRRPAPNPEVVARMARDVAGELDREILDLGKRAFSALEIPRAHPEILKLVGRLNYRTSYTQNQWKHAVEAAFLCGMMADELGLDRKLARRAALMHDIGKALTHELDGSHAVIGADYARRLGETEVVANAIGAHHTDEPFSSPYAYLVAAADAMSGARPGARRQTEDNHVAKLADLERLSRGFAGVEEAFAVQGGREVRVYVREDRVDDLGAVKLSSDIAEVISREMTFPGQIKVTVIREFRAIETAS
jgi:ribonuclease Y